MAHKLVPQKGLTAGGAPSSCQKSDDFKPFIHDVYVYPYIHSYIHISRCMCFTCPGLPNIRPFFDLVGNWGIPLAMTTFVSIQQRFNGTKGQNECEFSETFVSGAGSRLHRGGLQHPLSLRLQAERMVQLVTLQQVLRQWGQSSLQMAQRKTL